MSKPRGPWIQTYLDKAFYPLSPKADDIHIYEIAKVLSRTPRFRGHTKQFYSVAEHCVWVSSLVPQEFKLAALLHDAHEVYSGFGDVASPVKNLCPQIKKIELGIDKVIAEKMGFDVALFYDPVVKQADLTMLLTESRYYMGEPPQEWESINAPVLREILSDPMPIWAAEKVFRNEFNTLCPLRKLPV